MPRVLRYGSGVTRYIPGAGEQAIRHDDDIVLLQKTWRASKGVRSAEFRDSILRNAVRLFNVGEGDMSGFTGWIQRQFSNNTIHDHNYEFLLDCVDFITTGHRKMSPEVRSELMDINPSRSLPHRTNDFRIANFVDEITKEAEVQGVMTGPWVLIKWMSHPDGVYDLMKTMFVLFGERDAAQTTVYTG